MLNARSIATPGKMDEIRSNSAVKCPDILIITESWLNQRHESSFFYIKCYTLFRQDRDGGTGGGIAIWINSNIKANRVYPKSSSPIGEHLFLEFAYNSNKFLLCGTYIPPNRNQDMDESLTDFFINEFDVLLDSYSSHHIVLCGDFNRLDVDSIASAHSLEQKVFDATRDQAILDQFYVSSTIASYYPQAEVGPPPFTKCRRGSHCQVFLKSSTTSDRNEYTYQVVYDCRAHHIQRFFNELRSLNFLNVYREDDVDQKVALFYEKFRHCLSIIPQETVRMSSRDKPWMSPYLKSLITKRWNAYRAGDLLAYDRLKDKCKKQIIRNKNEWYQKVKNRERNPWSIVKDFTGKSTRNPIDQVIKDFESVDVAVNAINQTLSAVFLDSDNSEHNLDSDDGDWCPLVSIEQVFLALNRLKISKSTGSDGIPNKFYKMAAPFLAEPICNIINTSILQRKVPKQFKFGVISPIPKCSPPNVNQLRPITLLSVPSKILEKQVLNSVKSYITVCAPSSQFAYRVKSNTTCALISLHDNVTKQLDSSEVAACALLSYDFSKAFDRISHNILMDKLSRLNFPPGFLHWLQDYLRDRYQSVRIKNCVSNPTFVSSGIPQGSLLGPYLFILYCYDLRPELETTFMTQYADDVSQIVVLKHDFPAEFSDAIKIELENIHLWASRNNFHLNESKTCAIILKKKCNHSELSLPFNIVSGLKLLGVLWRSNLSWSDHFNIQSVRCSKYLYLIRLLKSTLSHDDLWMVYESLIQNVLLYSSPLFGELDFKCRKVADKLFRRARRIICSDSCTCAYSLKNPFFSKHFASIKKLFIAANSPNHPLYPIVQRISNKTVTVPYSRTNRRRNSFAVFSTLVYNDMRECI